MKKKRATSSTGRATKPKPRPRGRVSPKSTRGGATKDPYLEGIDAETERRRARKGPPTPTREEQAAHFAALALGYRALARMGTNQEHFMALAHEARATAAELGCNIVFKDDKVGT